VEGGLGGMMVSCDPSVSRVGVVARYRTPLRDGGVVVR